MDYNYKSEEANTDSEQRKNLTGAGETDEISLSEEVREPVEFSAREWLALLASFGLAVLCEQVLRIVPYTTINIPSLGITALVFVFVAIALIYLGKKAKYSAVNILLLTAVLLMALSCTLFGNLNLRILNCLGILSVGAMTMFQISGQAKHMWSSARVIGDTIVLGALSLFANVNKPFKALPSLKKGKGHGFELFIGAIIAAMVLVIILPLLTSADVVFSDMISDLGDIMSNMDFYDKTWDLFKILVYMLLLFSVFYSMSSQRKIDGSLELDESEHILESSSVAYATVLVILNVVYIAFVTIQIRFLFGSAGTAAIRGGYSEYARSGFFQLVFVAIINLTTVLITITAGFKRAGKNTTVLKVLCILMLVLTSVILASALWRMLLYISVYGLSVLRMLTLWAIAVIAVGLAVAGIKIIKANTKFFPIIFVFALSTWIVFNYTNVDARIANYNVDAYFDGRIEQLDVQYLSSLSADAIPALRRVAEAQWDTDEAADIRDYAAISIDRMTANANEETDWVHWNFSNNGLWKK